MHRLQHTGTGESIGAFNPFADGRSATGSMLLTDMSSYVDPDAASDALSQDLASGGDEDGGDKDY